MNTEDLIQKWLNDELTLAENQAFEEGKDFELYKSIIDNAKHFKASNFSQPEAFKDFQSTYDSVNNKEKHLDWFKPFLRIASVVIIALGIYFTFFNTSETSVNTLASEQTSVVLPDQSEVVLNAVSEIHYNKSDWSSSRDLKLNGEAYFKVADGKTFNVVTSKGIVTVVGTEFNVKQRLEYFEVQCFEGKVMVTYGDYVKTLLAGDTFRVLEDNFSQDKIKSLSPTWIQNRSIFKAIPFKAVVDEFERQFNVQIVVENANLERLFTGGFSHVNIEDALLSITQPMELSFKTNDSNDIVIYGNKK